MLLHVIISYSLVVAYSQVESVRLRSANDANACESLECCDQSDCPRAKKTPTYFLQSGRSCRGCATCRIDYPTNAKPCGKVRCCDVDCHPRDRVMTYTLQSGRRCKMCPACRASAPPRTRGALGRSDNAPPATPPSSHGCPPVDCGSFVQLPCPPHQRRPIVFYTKSGRRCHGCEECVVTNSNLDPNGKFPPDMILPGMGKDGCPVMDCAPVEIHLSCPGYHRELATFPLNGRTCNGCMKCKPGEPKVLLQPAERKQLEAYLEDNKLPAWLRSVLCDNNIIVMINPDGSVFPDCDS